MDVRLKNALSQVCIRLKIASIAGFDKTHQWNHNLLTKYSKWRPIVAWYMVWSDMTKKPKKCLTFTWYMHVGVFFFFLEKL